jgi:hypothetical protein
MTKHNAPGMISLQGIDLLSLETSLRLSLDKKGTTMVFDPLRKKPVCSTPEEIVRQLWIRYLLDVAGISIKHIAVERMFRMEGMMRRFDLVVFDKHTQPLMLAEFKGPAISLSQTTFDQIARYNMKLQIPYSLVSNGRQHYCFQIDDEQKGYAWQSKLPFDFSRE